MRRILFFVALTGMLFFFLSCKAQAERRCAIIPSDSFARMEGDRLTLSSGKEVKIRIGESAAWVADSYLYTKEEIYEILSFVKGYALEKGYDITRKDAELVGEFRLHQFLYEIGYKEEQTKDLDLEYKADSRWYVNVASKIIGWCGF